MSIASDAIPANFITAEGTGFAVMDGRKLVFSEARQEIYELNDMAAYIWCRLGEGHLPAAVVGGLVDLGVPPGAAGSYVREILSEWRRLGLVIPAGGEAAGPIASRSTDRRQLIRIAGLLIEIHHASDALARLAAPAFAHLHAGGSDTNGRSVVSLSLSTEAAGDRFRLRAGGREIGISDLDGILPALKAQLTDDVLAHADYSIAIHAASLACRRRMLLLCGEPGAGKTTLAVALAHRGFGYAGDDIALLTPTGRVMGVPFAASVKSGAWPLVSGIRPDLEDLRIFRRSDDQYVRYLPPAAPPVTEPLRLGWVVLLRRRSHGPAALTHLDRIEAIRAILAEATAPGRRLSAPAFGLLAEAMAGAECLVLSYADLDDAVHELRQTCP
ncbi:hypothetical protein KXR53_19505 [Inquilinus limosus]|uniref:hypothetical protein n=1 Tax=Inquilinus limosus TaxID=171674 RepID=UPI003F15FF2F